MNVTFEINQLKEKIAVLEKQFEAMKEALDALAVPAKRATKKTDAE